METTYHKGQENEEDSNNSAKNEAKLYRKLLDEFALSIELLGGQSDILSNINSAGREISISESILMAQTWNAATIKEQTI